MLICVYIYVFIQERYIEIFLVVLNKLMGVEGRVYVYDVWWLL